MVYKLVSLLLGVFSLCSIAYAGNSGLQTIQKGNGLTLFYLPSSETKLSIWIQGGTQYENDSFPGLAMITHNIIRTKCEESPRLSAIGLTTSFSKELSVFHFSVKGESQIKTVTEEFIRIVTETTIPKEMIAKACARLMNEEQEYVTHPSNKVQLHYMKKMYGQDYTSVYPYGALISAPDIDPALILRFIRYVYNPYNSCLTLESPKKSDFTFLNAIEQWDMWQKPLFNYESIVKLISFKQLVKSSQKVLFQPDSSRLEYMFLLPGNAGLEQKGFELMACNQLLLNYFRPFAPVETALEINAYSSTLLISVTCPAEQIDSIHPLMIQSFRDFYKKIPKIGYEEAIHQSATELKNLQTKSPGKYLELAARTTFLSNNTFTQKAFDSLENVSPEKLYLFSAEYISQGDFVSTLQISDSIYTSLHLDSVYTDVDETIISLTVPFPKNGYTLIDTIHSAYLHKLEQLIRLNPDVLVQVNGFSDKSEYNKAYDDSIILFMDTLPGFKRVMPEILKKRYLPIEMMRSMQILRYLYNRGIPAERLSGTCQSVKDRAKKPEENMKCTTTFPFVRNPIPNYQYIQFAKP